ncbi:protein disulfide isomerase crld-1-like isoform X2 [Haliotis rufescens]|uniref:protein disulfide isomerase crld-1-like isoform X2 n=1 Tax=Haliotis rufescens TaxID=6454 RepID=UPI00201EBBBE|nr:protein disulfide isomerase crld-1-like isoform X2 [Haliotis rufescens]
MGARALIIDKAICYGKDNTNGACNQRGSCVAPNRCSCHTGYTGSQCEKCLDARADPEHFIWWHTNSHPDCALTCSWKNQWCWPGDCPDRRLRTSCKCRNGFVKHDGGSRYTKCDPPTSNVPHWDDGCTSQREKLHTWLSLWMPV